MGQRSSTPERPCQIFIPAKFAYEDDPPPDVPSGPNEVPIFEVELLDIK